MKRKHSVSIMGHKTSFSLEPAFWSALQALARLQNKSVSSLVCQIDTQRSENLSSALRVYVLEQLQTQLKKLAK